MRTLGFTAPILPGKSEYVWRFGKDIMGSRRMEMDESRKSIGQTRETVWIEPSPMGDVLVAYLEGQDSVRANKQFAASTRPFDLWFKRQAGAFTGIDFGQPLPEGFVEVLFESASSNSTKQMKSLAVGLPILPGKTDDLRRWAQELRGPRSGDLDAFRQRTRLTKAILYLQHSPMGDFAIQYSEGENPGRSYEVFATSNDPFDKWTRETLGPIHGIDFSKPFPGLPELAFDWRAG